MPRDSNNGRRKSASTTAKAADLERLKRMTVAERMLLALELGRRGRLLQKRAQKGRAGALGGA